ncbi:hypothetical protein U1Q18_008445 [Sarracenia purpurea var. burkii]
MGQRGGGSGIISAFGPWGVVTSPWTAEALNDKTLQFGHNLLLRLAVGWLAMLLGCIRMCMGYGFLACLILLVFLATVAPHTRTVGRGLLIFLTRGDIVALSMDDSHAVICLILTVAKLIDAATPNV